MSEKLRDEITRLKKIISRLEDEHKEEEDKKQPLAIDQLTQFNALLMKENEVGRATDSADFSRNSHEFVNYLTGSASETEVSQSG